MVINWSSKLAYAVGLITTDGNLSKDGRHIIFRSSDLDLLITFKACLDATNKISRTYNNGYTKKPSYIIQIGNVKLYRWLTKIGITPAKTYTLGVIQIPNPYFCDFLRGHLDGDGSIITYLDRYNFYRNRNYHNWRVYIKFISASEIHLRWLYNKIQKLVDIKGSFTCSKPKGKNRIPIWTIKFAKKNSIVLLKWIYYNPNLPCLERKKLIASMVLNIINNEKRRSYTRIRNQNK